jgi:hypothetical protein
MRVAARFGLVIAALLAPLAAAGSAAAAPQPGLTVAPADITLTLPVGKNEQTTAFTVTNNYAGTIALRLRFEQSTANAVAGHKANALDLLSLSQPDITLDAGQAAHEVITLRDDKTLTPGSQSFNLVLTQAGASSSIGILPQLRLPVSIVKLDGAVNNVALTSVHKPFLTFGMPGSVTLDLHNSGNMVAIPRGFAAITDGRAEVLSKGTINVASAAIAPDDRATMQVPLTQLSHPWLPGFYRLTVSYGLGGDQTARTATVRFYYIAWWHLALIVLITAVLCIAWRRLLKAARTQMKVQHKRPAPKRPALIGRDIS